MNCPNCGSTYSDGDAACRMCGHSLTPAAGVVATGALTPPEGLIPSGPGPELVDELAQRLQAAIGENYKIEKTLGAGGFAVVYLARDLHLKRRLAVKVLSPDLVSSKTVLERFRREAETVAQLSHPHIVPLHFIGQKDDLLYLAMECIDGGSLADWIEREGKLPTADVIRIICEVASALNYAHKRGVIHRDIKPQNVLIEADTGRTLVTDFGIARTAEGSSLTASGMLVGTPTYLSPEQVTGSPTDHRADIYALGVMSYEMLTGQPPFTGPTPTAVLMKRLSDAPTPIAKLRPDAPQVLRDVIDGMLAQNPDERFQSGAEIVRALGGATPVSGHHGTAEIVMRNRRKKKAIRNLWISIGLGAVLGVAVLSWALVGRSGTRTTVAAVDSGMVLIAAGKYHIGSDSGPDIVQPAHEVRLAAFGLDSLEVSVDDYAGFAATGAVPAPWNGTRPDGRLPVTQVLQAEAGNYCLWKHRDGGRLPTEEEWEAAARGSEARTYPWGARFELGAANTASAQRGGPAAVGSYPRGRTPNGLRDMIGNVWEWTSSPYAAYPGGKPQSGGAGSYVIRGAAWNTTDGYATTAVWRGGARPSTATRSELMFTGFRCAMPARAVRR
jgi:formylglycine-generating enzyme required for sulfatase activity/tRNA A-37 threonylcarbamoyl transferase component Bud32